MADDETPRISNMPVRGDRVRRRYEHGFAQVPRVLLTHEPPPTSNAVHCFALLDMHADSQTGACYPAQSTLMREMGASRRTVQRALDELERLGFIARFPRTDPRYGRVGTDYDLLDSPTAVAQSATPPMPLVTQGGRTGDTPPVSPVTTKQELEINKNETTASSGTRAPARKNHAADLSPSAPPDTDPPPPSEADVIEALRVIAPGADVRAVPAWVRQRGPAHVLLRIEWLTAVLADPKHAPIESPIAYLYTLLDTPDDQPPAAYRWLLRQRERDARRQAQREVEAAQIEQAAAAAERDKTRLHDLQASYFALPPDRQAEIDRAARAAVASGPAGRMVDVPPVPEAWDARTVGAVLWRQAVGELLRTERGATS